MNNETSIESIRAQARRATCGQLSDMLSSGELRESLAMSKTKFAELLAIKRQTIMSYESGVSIPPISIVKKLSEILNVTMLKPSNWESCTTAAPQRDWCAELIEQAARRAEAMGLTKGTHDRQRHAVTGCKTVLNGDPLAVASWYSFVTDAGATSTQTSNAKLVAAVATWASFNGAPELGEIGSAIKIALSAAGSHRD